MIILKHQKKKKKHQKLNFRQVSCLFLSYNLFLCFVYILETVGNINIHVNIAPVVNNEGKASLSFKLLSSEVALTKVTPFSSSMI